MKIEDLKKGFFVDEDALKARLEAIVVRAREYCKIGREGHVIITSPDLSTVGQIKLILAARAIASQLDSSIPAEVTVAEIAAYTGLPANQIRARGMDAIKSRFAESTKRGVYRAYPHKVEAFFEELARSDKAKIASA
ncbi:MAG TPA: hypothetical protein VNZ63_04945 [Verrucomicrobiae bacterium]|jgi:hypothetical protein|nr:hypothetical protein [Verrucomicrobiae bacterium]